MGRYTYAAYDWRTGVLVDELRLRDVGFASVLNGYGDLSAEVAMDPRQRPFDVQQVLQEGRTAIFAFRDGVPLWGGMLWQTDWEGRRLKIAASEYGSYWDARLVKRDQDGATVGDKDLLTHASEYYRDIHETPAYGRMMLQPGGWYNKLCGVRSQVTLEGRNRQTYYEVFAHLSRIENGFDFGFDVRLATSGSPEFVLNVAYPWRGVTAATTQLVFSRTPTGGNILRYGWPRDGTSLATSYDAVGDLKIKTYNNSSMIASGYPPLERSGMFSGVVIDSTLQAHANAEGTLRSRTATMPKLVVRADEDPSIGSYATGDVARIDIEDKRFPDGMSAFARIISQRVTPSQRGRSESVELLMDLIP